MVWKEKLLSIGGREILIKTVAQAVPTYTMGCFLLPKSLCDGIEGMMRIFFVGTKASRIQDCLCKLVKNVQSKKGRRHGF